MNELMRQMDDLVSQVMAIHQARIDEAWLQVCEEAGWIRPKPRRGGGLGYSQRDVRRLARARRLRDQLGLNENGIDVVLHMRRQIVALQEALQSAEQERQQREQQLQAEIRRLRRQIAANGHFE